MNQKSHAQKTCLCCQKEDVKQILSFGSQPPSNRFIADKNIKQDLHPLLVGQCQNCAMLQLIDPMPTEMVIPRVDWITYNEPEGHLDDLVEKLCRLPGLEKDARIIGLTYKDDSTLRRLNEKGFLNTYRYKVDEDLNITDVRAGLETIQGHYNSGTVARLKEKYGMADLLSVRHILEHARNPVEFIRAIRSLVKPDGYLWFEMPDCSKFIKACDYTFIWEEHITYFSKETLAGFLKEVDFLTLENFAYPYQFEDSLIGIVKNSKSDAIENAKDNRDELLKEGNVFGARYDQTRKMLEEKLQRCSESGKKIAVFGAGHLAAKFINMYGLSDIIECVVDDHPSKQGLFMPGSLLPIVGSSHMDRLDICLLSLNSESEKRVRESKQAYLSSGGKFYSIFADNLNSIYSSEI